MKPILLDKIASVTGNCKLAREVRVSADFPCREGDVVAARVTSSKRTYDQLELCTGRFSKLKKGDIIAGALGHRKALHGYAGHIPESLEVGGRLQILNLGGVLGICDSANPEVGAPFECEVLGQVLHFPILGERIGVPANIAQGVPKLDDTINTRGVPVIAVVGTCMNSGKTYACSSLIQEFTRDRKRVVAAKATGVSLRRDVLMMADSGAEATSVFTDFGVVTTTAANAPALTRTMLNRLASTGADVIVLELGDGLFGTYGVDTILAAEDIRGALSAVLLCANDPVGAWGGWRTLKEKYNMDPTVITGPVTDNTAGTEFIEREMGVPALNARSAPQELASMIAKCINLGEREKARV